MGIEPRPDSRYVAETIGYTRKCRPKPPTISWPNDQSCYRSPPAAPDTRSQKAQGRPISEAWVAVVPPPKYVRSWLSPTGWISLNLLYIFCSSVADQYFP
jgi:hypothetical protein